MGKKIEKILDRVNLNYVKHRRLKLGLSLQDMAESLGFKNASTYMKYEEGVYSFKANHLPMLANKMKCKIENFFEDNFAEIANSDQFTSNEKKEVI